MGSEKAFLLSVIYKGRKFPQGSAAVEAHGGEKTPPQGARRLWKLHAGGPEAVEAPRRGAPEGVNPAPRARRVVNLDT